MWVWKLFRHLYDNGGVLLDPLLEAEADLVDALALPLTRLGDADLVARLDADQRMLTRLAGDRLAVLAEVHERGLPREAGYASTGMWFADRYHDDRGAGTRLVNLARKLARHPGLRAAMAEANVSPQQAETILKSLAKLPVDLAVIEDSTGDGAAGDGTGAGVRDLSAEAEASLIGFAAQYAPAELTKLGDRILTHIAPEVAEAAERKLLERQEAWAHLTRSLHLCPNGDGRVRITGWVGVADAALMNAVLDPLCRPSPEESGEPRTPAQRRADAMIEVFQLAASTSTLPDNGGDRPQVVVTMPYDPIQRAIQASTLDTGERVSPTTARHLACDADLVPVLLDGPGQALDIGRQNRAIPAPMRRALILRDKGCTFPGCDRPARWTDAHHIVHWADGGDTAITNLALLCRFHHRHIHHTAWEVRLGADGVPEYLPPAHIDEHQQPRRNHIRRRE